MERPGINPTTTPNVQKNAILCTLQTKTTLTLISICLHLERAPKKFNPPYAVTRILQPLQQTSVLQRILKANQNSQTKPHRMPMLRKIYVASVGRR
jgi:hypothetical protein